MAKKNKPPIPYDQNPIVTEEAKRVRKALADAVWHLGPDFNVLLPKDQLTKELKKYKLSESDLTELMMRRANRDCDNRLYGSHGARAHHTMGASAPAAKRKTTMQIKQPDEVESLFLQALGFHNAAKRKTTMNLKQDEVQSLFQALGFHNAAKWDAAKCQDKVNSLDKMRDDPAIEKLSDKKKERVYDLIEAIDNGTEIEVVADTSSAPVKTPKKEGKEVTKTEKPKGDKVKAEKNGKHPPPAKAEKNGKVAKAEAKAKPKAAKKESAALDKFGMREGTRAARINAAISDKPLTNAEIMKAARYDKNISGHMRKLESMGHVKRVDGGKWVLASAKAGKAKAKK